jgi:cytochrome c551/c552
MKLNRSIYLGGVISLALSAGTASALDIKRLWEKNCVQCHGTDGKGLTKMAKKLVIPDLTDPKVQAKFTDDEMVQRVKSGVKDLEGKFTMKPPENVSDAEIRALIGHVRTLKAN